MSEKKLELSNIRNEMIKFYIEAHNVWPDLRFNYNSTIENWTFLHTAVDQSGEEIVDYLLQKKANPNINVKIYGTPLHLAIKKGNLEIIQLLLKNGADMNLQGDISDNLTALEYAVQLDNFEAYTILASSEVSKKKLIELEPSLMCIALKYNSKKIVEAYLNENVDVNYRSKDYGSYLHCAVHGGNPETIERLLDYGAEINYLCNYNNGTGLWDYCDLTALQISVIFNKSGIVKLLTKRHANVNLKEDNDTAALGLAISMTCHDDVINDLLNAGADIDDVDLSKYVGRDSIKKLIEKHAIKLDVAQLAVSEKYDKAVASDPIFRNECAKEIEIMKNTRVGDSSVKFYYLLRKNIHQLALYAKYGVVKPEVLEEQSVKQFPLYAGILCSRFWKGVERKNLIDGVEEFVYDACYVLPNTVVRNLFYYLDNRDLEILKSYL
ncbi:transient receptor potential cation channel subfamily A member 1-like [Cotesia typhae]|uniref:transient receptor potential cation channel subfamily A member 1-like n=1 Tax=Cotesia typhae TaxID=2053667 RepID=UPI003D6823FF